MGANFINIKPLLAQGFFIDGMHDKKRRAAFLAEAGN